MSVFYLLLNKLAENSESQKECSWDLHSFGNGNWVENANFDFLRNGNGIGNAHSEFSRNRNGKAKLKNQQNRIGNGKENNEFFATLRWKQLFIHATRNLQ